MENNFANNLKHIRVQNGLTQEQLGKILEKDYSTIGKWENGTRSPIMEDVIKLSEFFNIPLQDLIGKDLKEFSKKIDNEYMYTKTISDDGYSIEIKTPIPFEQLPKEEQQEMIDNAMEELLKVKKETRQKDNN